MKNKLVFRVVLLAALFCFGCSKESVKMIEIPGKNFKMSETEITQALYEEVMGENPSEFKGKKNPVETVAWYDAIYFCNKLSEKDGLEPVYSVDDETNVDLWNYNPHQYEFIEGYISQETSATGYRLPSVDEWIYAAKGGENFKYAGSDNIDEVAWYYENSYNEPHPVADKKPNGYGLYDMSGNVCEWCWEYDEEYYFRNLIIGCYYLDADYCNIISKRLHANTPSARLQDRGVGFRVVRTVK